MKRTKLQRAIADRYDAASIEVNNLSGHVYTAVGHAMAMGRLTALTQLRDMTAEWLKANRDKSAAGRAMLAIVDDRLAAAAGVLRNPHTRRTK